MGSSGCFGLCLCCYWRGHSPHVSLRIEHPGDNGRVKPKPRPKPVPTSGSGKGPGKDKPAPKDPKSRPNCGECCHGPKSDRKPDHKPGRGPDRKPDPPPPPYSSHGFGKAKKGHKERE